MNWQVQEAKQRFSELVRRTLDEGPQVVTRHGEEVVVVIAADEYRRTHPQDEPSLAEYLMSGPDLSQLDLTRSRELPREISFDE